MNKRLKAAIAGLAFVAGCEVGIALQLMKMIREYTVKEKALNEPLEASEEEIAAEQAINEELDAAADMEETCEEDTAEEASCCHGGRYGCDTCGDRVLQKT